MRLCMEITTLLLCLLTLLEGCGGIKWLGVATKGRAFEWTQNRTCSRAKRVGFTNKQIQMCRKNTDLMPTIYRSAVGAVSLCQQLFDLRRWNCSSVLKAPKLPRDLTTGTREQAFVYALSSAAVTHGISRACAIGTSSKCSCGPLPITNPPSNFQWGGCSDNLGYGEKFSEEFLDAPWISRQTRKGGKSKKVYMNLHNNMSGRKAVRDSFRATCKCHGVSGGCSVKTCWRSLSSFRGVAEQLKNKYGIAVEVKNKRFGKNKKLVPASRRRRSVSYDDLIYYMTSPDYCNPNPRTGSQGTRGRVCKRDSEGSDGCDSMCCGRGYRSEKVNTVERCHCKYVWCCYVKCKKCPKIVNKYTCR